MYDPTNPYASPTTTEMHPVAAEWLGSHAASVRKVANGLGLILAGNIVSLASVFGGVALRIAFGPRAELLPAITTGMMVGMIVALALHIAGGLFCLATPRASGAQEMIYGSVGATLSGLLIRVGVSFNAIDDFAQVLEAILKVFAGITFLIFLRQLARFVARSDFGRRAMSILVWTIVSVGGFAGGIAVIIASIGLPVLQAVAMARQNPQAREQAEAQLHAALQAAAGGALLGSLLIKIAVVVMLVTFIRYLILLANMRAAILAGAQG